VVLIELIFISNELLSSRVRHALRVPLEFISFAFIDGRMYQHVQNKGTFVVQQGAKKPWGNDVVYGALFLLNDFHFHIRSLDAYHSCSLSALGRNHTYDLHHRELVSTTPITFPDEEHFCSLKYKERENQRAFVYVGNPTHPNIIKRTSSRISGVRIVDGLDKTHYKELLREVLT
jgi:hypothetical protein